MTEDLRISMIQSHIIWEDRFSCIAGDVYHGIFHGRGETSRYDGGPDRTDYKGMG